MDDRRDYGRIGKRSLKPGAYRATFAPRDTAGNRGTARVVKFKIVKS